MHDFNTSLQKSHAAEDLPIWEDIYRKAFPTFAAMVNHRQDGWHQRHGIDRSVVLRDSKQILIDEKVRYKDYLDIALEYLSNKEANIPGWVCKSLQADYIAYAILPRKICYLLPVIQLQAAWVKHGEAWIATSRPIFALNKTAHGGQYTTVSCPVPINVLFSAIGAMLRIKF